MRVGRDTEDEYIPIFSFPDEEAAPPPLDGRHDPPGDGETGRVRRSGWNGIQRHAETKADIPELYVERNRSRAWIGVAVAVVALVVGFLLGVKISGGNDAAARGSGPDMFVNGIPEGFSADEPGALAAATSYVTVLGTPWLDDPETYVGVYETIAAPGVKSALAESARRALAALEEEEASLGATADDTLVLRSYPLATHVDSYTGVAATVRVWALTVLAVDGVLAPRSGWVVYTFSLLYESGTWKVSQLAAQPQGAGPDGGKPGDTALPEVLTEFDPLWTEAGWTQP